MITKHVIIIAEYAICLEVGDTVVEDGGNGSNDFSGDRRHVIHNCKERPVSGHYFRVTIPIPANNISWIYILML